MNNPDKAARVAAMMCASPRIVADIWQNQNGTWSHRKDPRGEFSGQTGAATDLRFALEWDRTA